MSWLNTPNKLHPPIRTDMVRSSEEQFASEPSVKIFFPLNWKHVLSSSEDSCTVIVWGDHIQLKPFPMIVLFNCVWMRNATEYWQFYYNDSGVSSDSSERVMCFEEIWLRLTNFLVENFVECQFISLLEVLLHHAANTVNRGRGGRRGESWLIKHHH